MPKKELYYCNDCLRMLRLSELVTRKGKLTCPTHPLKHKHTEVLTTDQAIEKCVQLQKFLTEKIIPPLEKRLADTKKKEKEG